MKKILKSYLIFIIITAWLLAGWPPIWQNPRIPPEIEEAKANTERQSPDAIITQTNLSGVITAIQDDPDSPDGNWWIAGQNVSTIAHVSFPSPTGNLTTGADVQGFRVLLRKTAINNSKTDNTYTIHLYENGVQKQSTIASGSNTPTGGVVVSAAWDAANLANADGSGVEVYISTTPEASGAPTTRGSIEVGAVEWNVDYTINNSPSLTVSQPDGVSDTVVVGQSYNITYDLSDAEDVATVDFYYDSDSSGLDGTAITGCQDQAEGTAATCSWNTTGMTAGDYYVYGIATDGVNPDVSDYSPGVITIQAAVYSVILDQTLIPFGFVAENSTQDTTANGLGTSPDYTVTATNNGNTTEKLSIKAGNTTNWTLAATAGSEIYTMKFCTSICDSSPTWNSVGIDPSYATLVASVAKDDTQAFDLQVGIPTSTTATAEQTITITVLAEAP